MGEEYKLCRGNDDDRDCRIGNRLSRDIDGDNKANILWGEKGFMLDRSIVLHPKMHIRHLNISHPKILVVI
mgnify:CR=1 FL=1